MYFTQNDFLKIYEWIKRHSIRDSEFEESTIIEDDDTVTVVTSKGNRKSKIKTLIEVFINKITGEDSSLVTKEELDSKGYLTEHQDISGKQDNLISGTNIKTINNQSILGSGNINIQGGEISEVIDKEIYYNDGSNEVVPIKHPDPSTQPSILPYKFMGQYVYEQLIPKSAFTYLGSSHEVYLEDANLEVLNPILLEACLIYSSGILYSNVTIYDGRLIWQCSSPKVSDFLFAKIIYTSMPEEGEYYYYNESVGFDKYVKLYGEANFLINQGVVFNCAIPYIIYNISETTYADYADDNVFTFTLTENQLTSDTISINCDIDTKYYADIYILNDLVDTFEISEYGAIIISDYKDAVLNKQLRIVVRA